MADRFRDFLADSLAAVKLDAPVCAHAMTAALGPTSIGLRVDDERFVVYAAREIVVGDVLPAADACGPAVAVDTTARALLDLIDGRDELLAAILTNRLRVRAAPRDAERLFDAMRLFVEGCARAAATPALLAAMQRSLLPLPPDPNLRST